MIYGNLVVCSKKCKVFTFHETLLILSGVSRKICQGPKCTSQIWKCAVIGLPFSQSIQQTLIGEDCVTSQMNVCGGGYLRESFIKVNCPNQDRLQVTCLFPSRVSVSRGIKPILETGCCAKQRPPDFFSQKVILFCVTGIK